MTLWILLNFWIIILIRQVILPWVCQLNELRCYSFQYWFLTEALWFAFLGLSVWSYTFSNCPFVWHSGGFCWFVLPLHCTGIIKFGIRERDGIFFYEVGESVFMKEKAGMENQLRSMLGKIHMEVENLDTYSPKTFPAHVPTEIEYPSLKTEWFKLCYLPK